MRFVSYADVPSQLRVGESKIGLIRRFLEEHSDRAQYSVEIREALSGSGVKPGDIMASVRILEKKGLVYVRGYRSGEKQTPF